MTTHQRPAVFIRQYGNGLDPCFCLHDWNGDHRNFAPLLPHLPSGARLYSADLPGCGLSPAPKDWDLETVTAELAAAFQSVDAQPMTLVAEGIGALLGLRAALKQPKLFRRLILIDAFASAPWYFPLTADRDYQRVLSQIPSLGEFARMDVPVDIIFGSRTSRAVRQSVRIWQDLWNVTRTWEVPHAGHNVLAEAPDVVSTLIFGGSVLAAPPVPARPRAAQLSRP